MFFGKLWLFFADNAVALVGVADATVSVLVAAAVVGVLL